VPRRPGGGHREGGADVLRARCLPLGPAGPAGAAPDPGRRDRPVHLRGVHQPRPHDARRVPRVPQGERSHAAILRQAELGRGARRQLPHRAQGLRVGRLARTHPRRAHRGGSDRPARDRPVRRAGHRGRRGGGRPHRRGARAHRAARGRGPLLGRGEAAGRRAPRRARAGESDARREAPVSLDAAVPLALHVHGVPRRDARDRASGARRVGAQGRAPGEPELPGHADHVRADVGRRAEPVRVGAHRRHQLPVPRGLDQRPVPCRVRAASAEGGGAQERPGGRPTDRRRPGVPPAVPDGPCERGEGVPVVSLRAASRDRPAVGGARADRARVGGRAELDGPPGG